jgi:UDP-N-acetyl-D-glucosamine dehydrogenase
VIDDPQGFFNAGGWTLGVMGLGYVGLPLIVSAHQRGLGAIGFDVSADRVERLRAGRSPVDDVSDESLQAAFEAGAIVTTDPSELAAADAILICVPSPLGRDRKPDLSYIQAAAAAIREVARPGQLIALESTTYPGTTDDHLIPAVEAAGLTIDRDVWVAFSPERVSPGDGPASVDIPKVVGGVTPRSTEVAAAAYRHLAPMVHTVSSARAAEMTKLVENTYRAVNIALVNELAQLAAVLDLDIWEVIEAAATKPFGFQPFWPGPGVGGHCIPLDPQYLAWRAREANFSTEFIDLAERVNTRMPIYNADRITALLTTNGGDIEGAEVLAVGVAYKRDIADARESASLDVIAELERRGATVTVLDPVVGTERLHAMGLNTHEPDSPLNGYAIAAILTDHSAIDYPALADAVPLVYDARGVYRRLGTTPANVDTL